MGESESDVVGDRGHMLGMLNPGGVLPVLGELLCLRVAARVGVGRVDDQRERARVPVAHLLDGGGI